MATPTPTPKPATPTPPKPSFTKPEFKGERQPSIIPPEVTHVTLFGGFYGSGKTTMAVGTDHPDNVLFIDLESKGEGVANRAGVANYFCPPQDAAGIYGFNIPPRAIFDRTREILEAVPQDRFSVLLIDGLAILQDSMLEVVKASPQSFGVNPANAISGSMGGAWPGVGMLLQRVFNVARAKGIQVVAVTTEAKAKWGSTGPVLNKFQLNGQSIIHKMSVLSLVMIPGFPQYNGAPSALVLKEQLGDYKWVDGKQIVTKRIPPKLPWATMEEVYRYLREPADYGKLKPEEIPSLEEIEPFKPIVSKDQLASMDKLLELSRLANADASE